METRSILHLQTAERNRIVAETLLHPDDATAASPEWSEVVAFYAAVHLVNAYLWERLQVEPHDHLERTRFGAVVSDLKHCRGSYQRLRSTAFQARHEPGFRMTPSIAFDLIVRDLGAIESAVRSALGQQ